MRVFFPYSKGTHGGGPTSFINAFLDNSGEAFLTADPEQDVDVALFIIFVDQDQARRFRERGVKIVLRLDGLYHDPAVDYQALNAPILESVRSADAVIFQSHFCRRFFEAMTGPLQIPHTVILNGVDTSRFIPRLRRPPRQDKVRFYHAVNIHPQKRFHEALRLIETWNVPGWRLISAGNVLRFPEALDDALQDRYAEHVLRRRPNVRHLGQLPRDALARLASTCHIMLHPAFRDPCPNAVLEAMACGLPVVCEDTGGAPELVGPAGVVIPAPADSHGPMAYQARWPEILRLDEQGWLKGVRTILDDYANYSEMARARALELDMRKTAARYLEFLERVVNGLPDAQATAGRRP